MMSDLLHDAHEVEGHARSVRLSSAASLNGIEQLVVFFSGPKVTLTRMDSQKKPKKFVLTTPELVDLYAALQGYLQACDAFYAGQRVEMEKMLDQAIQDTVALGGIITDITEEEGYHERTMYYCGKLTFAGELSYLSMQESASIYVLRRRLDEINKTATVRHQ